MTGILKHSPVILPDNGAFRWIDKLNGGQSLLSHESFASPCFARFTSPAIKSLCGLSLSYFLMPGVN